MAHDVEKSTSVLPIELPFSSTVILVVNKLREVLAKVGGGDSELELPQVAIVGSQSSGNSSVLEALVGHDFLPRGSNICTRRPLLLPFVWSNEEVGEFGEFWHLPGRKFFDFTQIRAKIQVIYEKKRSSPSSYLNIHIHGILFAIQLVALFCMTDQLFPI
ncbi:hypothetical protein Lser_V15G16683 [Lactuca serriola]